MNAKASLKRRRSLCFSASFKINYFSVSDSIVKSIDDRAKLESLDETVNSFADLLFSSLIFSPNYVGAQNIQSKKLSIIRRNDFFCLPRTVTRRRDGLILSHKLTSIHDSHFRRNHFIPTNHNYFSNY